MPQPLRILVSGGGSAGHISPTLAVCDALKQQRPEAELLYVGEVTGMEARIVGAYGLEFAAIRAGKFRRNQGSGVSAVNKLFNPRTLGLNVRDSARVLAGVGGSLRILRHFRPDVIFLKGGFVTLPVGLAARILRIPYVIHESDVSPGLANRILGRWAAKIAVGFPIKSYHDFDRQRLVYTGNPVRPELADAHRLEGLAALKLTDDLPVILVTGGSQGARGINDVILDALPELLAKYQVVHLAGEKELPRIEFELGRMGRFEHSERYHPYAFLMSEMAGALAAADLVIARAGANTVAELATLQKPTVLIPNYQMAGHQVENARVLARQGAVRVLDERTLTPAKLMGEVNRILSSVGEQKLLSEAIGQLAKPDAAAELASVIIDTARVGESPVEEPV